MNKDPRLETSTAPVRPGDGSVGDFAARADAISGFVTVEGNRFQVHGRPYYFVGTNLWFGAYLGHPGELGDRTRLIGELNLLEKHGITNLRVLAASEATTLKRAVRPATVQAPGEYDEDLLIGLDFLLAEMARRDMKAVLYLTNFRHWSGGMSQYASWASGVALDDPDVAGDFETFTEATANFYRDDAAQQFFRDTIAKLISRRNSITGVAYARDPTIMSWQLANEPRAGEYRNPANFERYSEWIDATAAYIHSLAPHHLVSTGNEGTKGSFDDEDLFVRSHQSAHVDYLTFHLWAKNWNWFDALRPAETYETAWGKAERYLNHHIDIAQRINKPIVLEEFGLDRDGGRFEPAVSTRFRDRYYAAIFDLLQRRALAGDAIAGSNFWAWGGAGRTANPDFMWQEGDDCVGDPPQEAQGLNCVFDSDISTLSVIEAHAMKMREIAGR